MPWVCRPPLSLPPAALSRRAWIATASSTLLAALGDVVSAADGEPPLTLHTFGDSVLDCGHYNAFGLNPGRLIVRNDDRLFPEFKGKDLAAQGPARLAHHAMDGATVDDLPRQARGLATAGRHVALLTVGGNDLLRGLAADKGPGVQRFESALDAFVRDLPVRPLLMGTVYDPTFGDDSRNFLGIDARIARANLQRVNAAIAASAQRHGGRLVDLHAHFLGGEPSWFTRTIEPSLVGASEVRRAFLARLAP
jgi:hypothetical protein